MRSASVSAEQALLVQAHVCLFAHSLLGTEWELGRMSGVQSSAWEVGCWSGGARVGRKYSSPGRPLTPARRSGQVGCMTTDAPHTYIWCQVNHVDGPTIRGYDDLTIGHVDLPQITLGVGNCIRSVVDLDIKKSHG
ncbi:hypothetical protein B296_00008558 [Ensete ventricosum]|uniref:Uncharacterized protein n=1 Tax=Ensete ventricosum TaxID=4639 RepID=A0A427AZ89_ENSVE|nr:hypothetical protein B296_00008558 [Ensete ventricosum]